MRRPRRWLFLLMLCGTLRGLFWVAVGPVFNPIDEAQHFGFVTALATGTGIPDVRDPLPEAVLALAKRSPTLAFRSEPVVVARPRDPRWGVFARQYEAMQGPAYYALMVPAWWLGRPFGTLGSLYAVRVASLLVAMLAVPLTYALSLRLFPRRHAVALGAAALLVAMEAPSANPAAVNNDALAVPLALATVWAGIRFFQSPRPSRALLLGAAVGLGFLTKGNLLFVVPALAGLALLPPFRKEVCRARPFGLIALAGIVAVAVVLPWIWWNRSHYGALTAARTTEAMLAPLLPHHPFGLVAIRAAVAGTRAGLWRFQSAVVSRTGYEAFWELVLGATLAVAAGDALRRRRWAALARLAWLGATPVVAFTVVLAVDYLGASGRSGVTGRHIAPTVPLLAIAMGAGAAALGRRWAPVAVAGVVALALALEAGNIVGYRRTAYGGLIEPGGSAPRLVQTLADTARHATGATISAPCPVTVVRLS